MTKVATPTHNRNHSRPRPTNMEDRNTYIGDMIDSCLDELELQDNPDIQLLR